MNPILSGAERLFSSVALSHFLVFPKAQILDIYMAKLWLLWFY